MKKIYLFITVTILSLLAACSGNSNQDELSNAELKELVQQYSVNDKTAQSASISSTDLIITEKDGQEKSYSLPNDEFFVSIAPYEDSTHPCTNHSLTGCQGEMANTEFDVYIEDMDGNVLIDEPITSFDNGFIDLWLPKDKTYKVTIKHDGKVVESEISTFEEDGTCITTMQLI
ncbi:CueP family metal-binding protein [Gracilibacillus massiliensis]|uniref:CueP family metal-binding protein n=1 Tax=Gracilibacillus massiliensis TaxID=1564956 RepID=UPI00071CD1F2|nr:CueP family metal-binding protein [Gracilibacillus massiliensis]